MNEDAAPWRQRWQWCFEWVIVPVLGVMIVLLALAGADVPDWVKPLVPGMWLFPFARMVDRLRQEK